MTPSRSMLVTAALLCGALAAPAAFAAQAAHCAGPAASAAAGDCPMPMHGPGRARAHGRWGADYTPGWMLMTPQERKSFAAKMRAAGSREECQALVEQQRAEIETRAKATGTRLAHRPRRMACAGLPHAQQAHKPAP